MKKIYFDSKKRNSELREYALDKNEIERILSNHSRFHPTPNQMIILKDMASKLSDITGLDATLIEAIYIDAIVKRQLEDQVFHFELENSLPQIRLTKTMRVRDLIQSEFTKICTDSKTSDMIKSYVNEVLEYYLDKYVNEVLEYYLDKYVNREVNQEIVD